MAALGNFSNALLMNSQSSIGKRPDTLKQGAILSQSPKVVVFAYKNQPTRKIIGTVFEKITPVSRVVFAFGEDLIALNQDGYLGKTVSDPITGIYTIDVGTYSGNISVVAMDGNFNSRLISAIDSLVTTITIADIPFVNLNGLFIMIDNEIMLVSSGGNTATLTVVRAQKLSTAAPHLINATITKLSLNSRIFSKITPDFV